MTEHKKYWMGTPPDRDDFGSKIKDEFLDARTRQGPWAIMTPENYFAHGLDQLGTGYGQRYKKQEDGRWLKIEG